MFLNQLRKNYRKIRKKRFPLLSPLPYLKPFVLDVGGCVRLLVWFEQPALKGPVGVGRLLDRDPDLGLLGPVLPAVLVVLLVVAAARASPSEKL